RGGGKGRPADITAAAHHGRPAAEWEHTADHRDRWAVTVDETRSHRRWAHRRERRPPGRAGRIRRDSELRPRPVGPERARRRDRRGGPRAGPRRPGPPFGGGGGRGGPPPGAPPRPVPRPAGR